LLDYSSEVLLFLVAFINLDASGQVLQLKVIVDVQLLYLLSSVK